MMMSLPRSTRLFVWIFTFDVNVQGLRASLQHIDTEKYHCRVNSIFVSYCLIIGCRKIVVVGMALRYLLVKERLRDRGVPPQDRVGHVQARLEAFRHTEQINFEFQAMFRHLESS